MRLKLKSYDNGLDSHDTAAKQKKYLSNQHKVEIWKIILFGK